MEILLIYLVGLFMTWFSIMYFGWWHDTEDEPEFITAMFEAFRISLIWPLVLMIWVAYRSQPLVLRGLDKINSVADDFRSRANRK